jgi:hypothetical protein
MTRTPNECWIEIEWRRLIDVVLLLSKQRNKPVPVDDRKDVPPTEWMWDKNYVLGGYGMNFWALWLDAVELFETSNGFPSGYIQDTVLAITQSKTPSGEEGA